MKRGLSVLGLSACIASTAIAQTSAPVTAPQTNQPGQQTIVVNPTVDECATGWNSNLKWSQTQFDQMCATLSRSK